MFGEWGEKKTGDRWLLDKGGPYSRWLNQLHNRRIKNIGWKPETLMEICSIAGNFRFRIGFCWSLNLTSNLHPRNLAEKPLSENYFELIDVVSPNR